MSLFEDSIFNDPFFDDLDDEDLHFLATNMFIPWNQFDRKPSSKGKKERAQEKGVAIQLIEEVHDNFVIEGISVSSTSVLLKGEGESENEDSEEEIWRKLEDSDEELDPQKIQKWKSQHIQRQSKISRTDNASVIQNEEDGKSKAVPNRYVMSIVELEEELSIPITSSYSVILFED